ncbi:hypothetical protein QYM36_017807 [Artemia franciscana]|uniref:C-CAP/cofactor C-like domain-containing protein n=1 Tax=Artemia franciscana TaxID=6661 RepID=A0AA88HAG1_ARTSF|nr:hypothetical protein QYM36_017807 [Artemia franciscana]
MFLATFKFSIFCEVSRILNESLVVLPSYERCKIQSNLQKYSADLTQAIDVKPKKFGFCRNVVESDLKKDVVDRELLKRETAKIERNIEQDIKAVPKFVLEGLQNDQKTILNCKDEDVLIKDCKNATITINEIPGTVHLINLSNSVIVASPLKTSIFIRDCKNCQFYLSCQQLRMHASTDCDVSLHVNSRAIIEDCSKIRFGPLPLKYSETDKLDVCGFKFDPESHKKVDDFNWLSKGQSPNWSLLSQSKNG